MRSTGPLPSLALTLLLGACASGPATTSGTSGLATSARDAATSSTSVDAGAGGAYSASQAERGRTTFRAICAECHYSSEFRGSRFQFSWGRRSAADFYDEVSGTMPEDAPGSLDPQVYLDVVAYVLELNGFPAGDADLPLDEAVLAALPMTPPPSSATR